MKKIFATVLISFALLSCTDTKKQEKELLNDVIKTHDMVMEKDELIMINKMQLDTLIKENKQPTLTAPANALVNQLEGADAKMENWMHKFDAENKGKSHDEIMTYLTDQKRQIVAIDKELNATIALSSKFIKENKIK